MTTAAISTVRAPPRKTVRQSSAAKKVAPEKPATPQMNLRVDEETRHLIDRAANALGQSRTEFMLSSARERAVEVLLSRTLFVLDHDDWMAFAAALDAPPQPNAKLKALLSKDAPWDEKPAQRNRRKAA